MTEEEQREAERKKARENDRLANSVGGAIEAALLAFFKSVLPSWLFDFIFEEDANAPNESAEDMVPATAGEKVASARAVYSSGAVKKWEASKSEYAGGEVVHSSPVAGVNRSSGYGMRMHPIHKEMRMHYGDDLTGGGDIRASAEGTVLFAGRKGGYGQTVIIGHDDGTKTLYGHMTGAKLPQVGERVERGEVIGVMGSTGQSTGTHLHYEQFDKNGRHRKPVIDGVAAAREHDHDEHATEKVTSIAKPAKLEKSVAKVKPAKATEDDDGKPALTRKANTVAHHKPSRTSDDGKLDWSEVTDGVASVANKGVAAISNAVTAIGSAFRRG